MSVSESGLAERRAVAKTLARTGDRWRVMAVGALQHGPLRYNELCRIVEGISQRMVARTLVIPS